MARGNKEDCMNWKIWKILLTFFLLSFFVTSNAFLLRKLIKYIIKSDGFFMILKYNFLYKQKIKLCLFSSFSPFIVFYCLKYAFLVALKIMRIVLQCCRIFGCVFRKQFLLSFAGSVNLKRSLARTFDAYIQSNDHPPLGG